MRNIIKVKKAHRKHIKSTTNINLYTKLVNCISNSDKKIHIFIAIIATIIGFFLNSFIEMQMFWIKGLFGLVLYITLSFTIIYISKQNRNLIEKIKCDSKLKICSSKYEKRVNSNMNFLFCIIASVYFLSISIILDFVDFSPIGIYSLIALFCVVFFAFIILQQYINILVLLFDISKIHPNKINYLIPEKTNWFIFLEKFSRICRNLFIVLGSLFILLFTIFSPINSLKIIFQLNHFSIQLIILFFTWIIILIAIVFMIPFSSIIRYIFLNKIYNNLIEQSIRKYSNMYKKSKNHNKMIYIDIILRISEHKYVLKDSYTWILPLVINISNYISIIFSIITDLKELKILT